MYIISKTADAHSFLTIFSLPSYRYILPLDTLFLHLYFFAKKKKSEVYFILRLLKIQDIQFSQEPSSVSEVSARIAASSFENFFLTT